MIVNAFIERQDWNYSSSSSLGVQKIVFYQVACEAHETLPRSAEFRSDVFTSR
ncbi:hypothetical protein MKW92_030885 [Papaver armeniacum]|nr:hypothetical protein MKW92_030885 [Papaver armeniacum]